MSAAKRRRLGRRISLVVIVMAVAAAASAAFWVPRLGSRIAWLEVERVEVTGAVLMAPHEVLRVSGIRQGRYLFDDLSAVESSLKLHPVLADAHVTRGFPNRLSIRVEEKEPIALLADGELVPVTRHGEVLPVDPIDVPLDLPIVVGSLEDPTKSPDTRRLLTEAGRLAEMDPALISEVSEIRYFSSENDVLVLIHDDGKILIPFGASVARLEQLRAVLADVRGRRSMATVEGTPARSPIVDLRYDDQVVVRNQPSHELS
jgi:cell division protein FtsQ